MKSKTAEAKAIILSILSDGNAHSAEEFREKLQEKGISRKSADSAVRNAIYKIKQTDSRLTVIGRGMYCLKNHVADSKRCEESKREEIDSENALLYDKIFERITYIKNFNWVSCSDNDLANARQEVKRLAELEQRLVDFFKTYARV